MTIIASRAVPQPSTGGLLPELRTSSRMSANGIKVSRPKRMKWSARGRPADGQSAWQHCRSRKAARKLGNQQQVLIHPIHEDIRIYPARSPTPHGRRGVPARFLRRTRVGHVPRGCAPCPYFHFFCR